MATPNNKELKPLASKPLPHHLRASVTKMYSGPIPPAEELIKYEQACPGAADRIICMAENQATHRQGLEAKVIGSNVGNEKIGMYLAFILTFLMILVGTYLIMNNKSVIGFIAIFSPCLFQAGNYIYIKYYEHKHVDPNKKN